MTDVAELKIGDVLYGFYIYEYVYTEYEHRPIKGTIVDINSEGYIVNIEGCCSLENRCFVLDVTDNTLNYDDFVLYVDKDAFLGELESHIGHCESEINRYRDMSNELKGFKHKI